MIKTRETTAGDRSAALQRATREFTSLYEEHAYLVYNLALRTTCDASAAWHSAKLAFLAQAGGDGSRQGVIDAAVTRAITAASGTADAAAAGEEHAQAMLAATARLSAPERAALAMSQLAGLEPAEAAGALGLNQEASAKLFERAWENLRVILEKTPEETQHDYTDWLWAEPPAALWEDLYAEFYRAVERDFRYGQLAPRAPAEPEQSNGNGNGADRAPDAAAAAGASTILPAGAVERLRQIANRSHASERAGVLVTQLRRLPRWATILAVILIAGGVAAAKQAGLLDTTGSSNRIPGPPPVAQSFGKLSPQKLDQLRLQELKASQRLAAQQIVNAHNAAERKVAIAKQARIEALLRKREAAMLAKRRHAELIAQRKAQLQALRQQQLAQQQAAQAQPIPVPAYRPPPVYRPPTQRPSSSNNNSSSQNGSSTTTHPGSQQQASKSCLYNPDQGTYVCPQ
jgi:hypothetical protein